MHDHVAQFYEDARFLVDSVGAFLGEGLLCGEPVLVVATPSHRLQLTKHLAEHGHDVEALIGQGRLALYDAEEALARFMVHGQPDMLRFEALACELMERAVALSPNGHVRSYGEMVNLLWRAGSPKAALRLEELWNALARRYSFSLLCSYSMSNFSREHDGGRFDEVCRAHSRVIPTESYLSLTDADSRAREISQLQQRAQALESEIERRKQVETELREALRVRDDFLSVAGHELRTPLTVLRLQLSSLLATPRPEQEIRTERRLAALSSQTERLARLAERLLDVSQIADSTALQLSEVDLTDLVRSSVASFADLAAAAGCQLRMVADASVSGRWDRDRIDQVLQDLLSNALKFGKGSAVRVVVRGLPRHAEILVSDGGRGIPLADQQRIFARFERSAPTESFGGLGLGLWIARQLVEAHGGEIRVESQPGAGATFIVSLPYETPAACRPPDHRLRQ